MPISANIRVEAPPGIPPKMVSEYLDRYRASLPAVWVALNGCDFEFLRVFGHRLKGSGSAYGCPLLTTIGASIEQAALKRDPGALENGAAALQSCLQGIEVVAG